ncbi:uncharacterized protein ANIA_11644 [Aspergillus nidulans FGSC A4]|uniref:Uncharacterized protein n=1 Tax=Emericella nidulans (strain FGSC A4 / ATCC 38163 / CBS 112.46 / NRRL 194 / M139) TaxID=227321 RepID=C8VJT3_EMENI|nr:hypothetical protein [Aspergillus nidulans FGSC A4]CBF82333.1 TPA: hypothetical protein ANIA_11644 [Aspergillus nidulans FGSC A4]
MDPHRVTTHRNSTQLRMILPAFCHLAAQLAIKVGAASY